MPKMKTKKAAAKRFKVTGNGKIKRPKANKSHKLTKKNSRRKRRLSDKKVVKKKKRKNLKKMMPYKF
ncbi:MAG TPA: 50S ribosomal protein L35 [Candidatus Mcinerneyibacterium sp.]|nr:50S ribosomal protein L35 [Candidatus Mcinerneyibacterium sp.]